MRTTTILLGLLLSACSPDPEPAPITAPRQAEAVALVWHDMLGRDEPPPKVDWVFAQPCKGTRWGAAQRLEIGSDGTCAAGYFAPGQHRVVLVIPSAAPAADQPFGVFSSSAMVHEFVHAALELDTGYADAGHRDHPERWAVVPFANAVLVADEL